MVDAPHGRPIRHLRPTRRQGQHGDLHLHGARLPLHSCRPVQRGRGCRALGLRHDDRGRPPPPSLPVLRTSRTQDRYGGVHAGRSGWRVLVAQRQPGYFLGALGEAFRGGLNGTMASVFAEGAMAGKLSAPGRSSRLTPAIGAPPGRFSSSIRQMASSRFSPSASRQLSSLAIRSSGSKRLTAALGPFLR